MTVNESMTTVTDNHTMSAFIPGACTTMYISELIQLACAFYVIIITIIMQFWEYYVFFYSIKPWNTGSLVSSTNVVFLP